MERAIRSIVLYRHSSSKLERRVRERRAFAQRARFSTVPIRSRREGHMSVTAANAAAGLRRFSPNGMRLAYAAGARRVARKYRSPAVAGGRVARFVPGTRRRQLPRVLLGLLQQSALAHGVLAVVLRHRCSLLRARRHAPSSFRGGCRRVGNAQASRPAKRAKRQSPPVDTHAGRRGLRR
jgi:hypothetical protein